MVLTLSVASSGSEGNARPACACAGLSCCSFRHSDACGRGRDLAIAHRNLVRPVARHGLKSCARHLNIKSCFVTSNTR
eukprot:5613657-Pleurochrysis_carterae.AAC.4